MSIGHWQIVGWGVILISVMIRGVTCKKCLKKTSLAISENIILIFLIYEVKYTSLLHIYKSMSYCKTEVKTH